MKINKTKMLKVVNPVMSIIFLCLAGTGMSHNFLPYEIFHMIHGKLGFAFVLLAVAHIYLNWNWIKNLIRKK